MDKEQVKIIKILREFKEEINKKIKLDKFILFGSRARGTQKETSDVDLLLISNDFKGKKYFRRSPEFYLMWDHWYNIDIICLTPAELEEKEQEIGIIHDAVREGVVI